MDGAVKSFDEVAGAIVKALDWLLGDAARAAELLGAIQNEATWRRVDEAAAEGGTVLRASARNTSIWTRSVGPD